MAHITQEDKREIAKKIKPLLKEYGIKGSLSIIDRSSILLKIMSGKFDFIENHIECCNARPSIKLDYYNNDDILYDYFINNTLRKNKDLPAIHFYPRNNDIFSGKCLEFLQKAYQALKVEGWRDNSDSQTDYFDITYYIRISFGSGYDKPYELIK